ncbi:hypothetical protein HZY83_02035 [Gemella sp. GH3]|nr:MULTISPECIES: hypothetical protein [unclassified Gemella]MBF0713468.1 hypothetical protein [Gemella sp. GH3.1]NYS50420.1 hypothetical protein [Gemella sp. GH3]
MDISYITNNPILLIFLYIVLAIISAYYLFIAVRFIARGLDNKKDN